MYKSAITKPYARLKKRPDFEAIRINLDVVKEKGVVNE